MKNSDALIAQAEILVADCASYNFGMRSADRLAHTIAPQLIAALYDAEARANVLETAIREQGQSHHFAAGAL